MSKVPPEYQDLFGPTADTAYFALITEGVTPEDATTLKQARLFYDRELTNLCLEMRNQPLPANGLIIANGSGGGEAKFYKEQKLVADGFPQDQKARLQYHFDNGTPIPDAQQWEEGVIRNPNLASKSESFEVHDLIKTYFDPSGAGGKNKVWSMIKDAVS